MDYEKDMEIQPDELDLEWLEQPALMIKYTKKLAAARENKDLAKEELELVTAQKDRDIRENPEDYDLEKLTETVIRNTILTTDEYKEASKAYIKANHQVNILQGAVSAVEQRKQALENLVRLHGQQYFAGPSVPRNLQEEKEARDKKVKSQMLERKKNKEAKKRTRTN